VAEQWPASIISYAEGVFGIGANKSESIPQYLVANGYQLGAALSFSTSALVLGALQLKEMDESDLVWSQGLTDGWDISVNASYTTSEKYFHGPLALHFSHSNYSLPSDVYAHFITEYMYRIDCKKNKTGIYYCKNITSNLYDKAPTLSIEIGKKKIMVSFEKYIDNLYIRDILKDNVTSKLYDFQVKQVLSDDDFITIPLSYISHDYVLLFDYENSRMGLAGVKIDWTMMLIVAAIVLVVLGIIGIVSHKSTPKPEKNE